MGIQLHPFQTFYVVANGSGNPYIIGFNWDGLDAWTNEYKADGEFVASVERVHPSLISEWVSEANKDESWKKYDTLNLAVDAIRRRAD